MNERNLETVRRLYAEMMSREGAADPYALAQLVPEIFDPEIKMSQIAGLAGTAGTFTGYSGLAKAVTEILRELDEVWFEPGRIEARGDAVAAVYIIRGRGRTSGVPVEYRGSHEYHLRDGRIVRWVVHYDPDEAFRAIGAEPPAHA